jgi:hypothetical protein
MMDAISRRVNRLTERAIALLLATMVPITGLAIAGRFEIGDVGSKTTYLQQSIFRTNVP